MKSKLKRYRVKRSYLEVRKIFNVTRIFMILLIVFGAFQYEFESVFLSFLTPTLSIIVLLLFLEILSLVLAILEVGHKIGSYISSFFLFIILLSLFIIIFNYLSKFLLLFYSEDLFSSEVEYLSTFLQSLAIFLSIMIPIYIFNKTSRENLESKKKDRVLGKVPIFNASLKLREGVMRQGLNEYLWETVRPVTKSHIDAIIFRLSLENKADNIIRSLTISKYLLKDITNGGPGEVLATEFKHLVQMGSNYGIDKSITVFKNDTKHVDFEIPFVIQYNEKSKNYGRGFYIFVDFKLIDESYNEFEMSYILECQYDVQFKEQVPFLEESNTYARVLNLDHIYLKKYGDVKDIEVKN